MNDTQDQAADGAASAQGLTSESDVELAARLAVGREQILTQLAKQIVGQEDVLGQVLMTLFVGGNSILTGVPGLAKTLIVQTVAQILDLKFSRIQVHARSDAERHHRHRHHPGRPRHGPAGDGLHAGSDLRPDRARG